MSAPSDREELLRLVDRQISELITAEEQRRLERMLAGDPAARQLYFASLDVDQGLRQWAMSRSSEVPPPLGPPAELPNAARPRRSPFAAGALRLALVAAASVAAVLLVQVALRHPRAPQSPSPPLAAAAPAEPVATLILAEKCRWKGKSGRLQEGARILRERLHLEQGLAVLRFDGGAEAILSGEVELELTSRGSARLFRGRLTARVPEEALGFTVQTPSGDVVDLGTEFAVDVKGLGVTELHVLDGAVEYRQPAERPGTGRLVKAGEAARYEASPSRSPQSVTMRAETFNKLLRQANPRPREDRIWTYEGFNYPTGDLPIESAAEGAGWAGPWRLRQGDEINPREADDFTGMRIAFQQMNVPWPVLGGRAGMLELPPGNAFRVRPMAKPLDLAKDAVYYVSLMVREERHPDASAPSRSGAVRLTLRSSQAYWGDRVALGVSAHRKPHIELADFVRFTSPSPVPGGQTLLWVAKIVARRGGDDEAFFRVYQEGETFDLVEPAQWSVGSRGFRSDAKLDLVLLSSTGDTRRWFDELRIGTNWRAIVPVAKPTAVTAASREPPPEK